MSDSPSAAREILDYEREVSGALIRVSHKYRKHGVAVEGTPLYALIESEEKERDPWDIRNAAVRAFFDYILSDGPHPAQILRRFFAVALHLGIEPLCNLTPRERELMLSDDPSYRLKLLCESLGKQRLAASGMRPGPRPKAKKTRRED